MEYISSGKHLKNAGHYTGWTLFKSGGDKTLSFKIPANTFFNARMGIG